MFFSKLFRKQMKRPRKKNIMLEALKIAGLVAILSPADRWLYDFILFHPDKTYRLDPRAIEAINKQFNSTWTEEEFVSGKDGVVLNGWFVKLPNARKTFLVSHGNAGNMAYRAVLIATLLHCGGSVFIYDYQGYGKSGGSPSTEGIVDDGLSAYDYLVKEKHVLPEDIIVYGESLGCAVSTQIAQRKVGGIILQSGFSDIVTAARDRLPWLKLYPTETFPQRFLDNVTAYKSAHAPLLLLHGEKDFVLPARYSSTIYNTACEPKRLVILPNCGHNDVHVQDVNLSTKAIRDFLDQSVASAAVAKQPAPVAGTGEAGI